MHAGLEKKHIQGHLLAFSAAAPVVAISTYFILHSVSAHITSWCLHGSALFHPLFNLMSPQSGNSPEKQLGATGVGMLFSAGTFLYVATVHVLPEISSSSRRTEEQLSDIQQLPEADTHKRRHLGVPKSLTLILGLGLPVLLALGLRDD